jgi:hypothetical protein
VSNLKNRGILASNINLCTIFDENYALQGLTMINSANKYFSGKINWHILALTSKCEVNLEKLNLSSTTIYSLSDIKSVDLPKLSQGRKWSEFCFASGPIFLSFLSSILNDGDILGYVDADCYFFNDINLGLDNFSQDIEIQIHEHRFSNDRIEWLQKSGRFNVGLVIGSVGETFRKCLTRWQKQVIEDSSVDETRGTCGDQKYLDEWPNLYESLQIMKSHGMGVAPWNLNGTVIEKDGYSFFADSDPLIFFHFHGLQIYLLKWRVGIWAPAPGYTFTNSSYLPIYSKYLVDLHQASNTYKNLFKFRKTKFNLKNLISLFFNRNLRFSFF